MAQKKILIVDDEQDVSKLLKASLESAGYAVFTAFDGVEALKSVKELSPDLILLDVMLPHLSGFEVCRLLKFDKKFQNIPVVLLTSRDSKKDGLTGKEVGANEYIPKYNFSDVAIGKVQELVGN